MIRQRTAFVFILTPDFCILYSVFQPFILDSDF